jgi:hypothetical protein
MTVLGGDVYENDNTYFSAKYIYSGSTQIHSIFPLADYDWVKFDLTAASYVDIKTSGGTDNTVMYLYDSAGVAAGTPINFNDDICGDPNCGYNYFSQIKTNLPAGTYYARISQKNNNMLISGYNLDLSIAQTTPTMTPTVVAPDAYESDNTYLTAKVITSGVVQLHSIHVSGDRDWVKFVVAQNSSVNINTSGLSGDSVIYLYDSTGVPLTYLATADDGGIGYFSDLTVSLGAGTYYVAVEGYMGSTIPLYYLQVTINQLTPTYTPTAVQGDSFENDNAFPDAKDIFPGTAQTHSMHVFSDVDWVKLTLTQEAVVHVWTSGTFSDTEMRLYDGFDVPATALAYDDNSGAGLFSSITMQLMPGVYYIRVNEKGADHTIDAYEIHVTALVIRPGLRRMRMNLIMHTPAPPGFTAALSRNILLTRLWIQTGSGSP